MKCSGDPACLYPARRCGLCARHLLEEGLALTLHEMSSEGRVVTLDKEGWQWPGFSIAGNGHTVPWDRRLRVGLSELTPEQKKRKYSNTYCRAKLENGVTCNAPIPVEEALCDDCKQRLLPEKK
jgi:hypothetical protein